jgi:hypothetical protein
MNRKRSHGTAIDPIDLTHDTDEEGDIQSRPLQPRRYPDSSDTDTAELPTAELPTAELPTAELPTAELPTAELPTADTDTAELPASVTDTAQPLPSRASAMDTDTAELATADTDTAELPASVTDTAQPLPSRASAMDTDTAELATADTDTAELPTAELPTAELPTAEPPPLPASLRFDSVNLLEHQVIHTERITRALREMRVAFDTSDTGTGKTYVACKAAEAIGCNRILVVCPNIVERKWTTILSELDVSKWMVFPYSLLTRTAKTNGFFDFTPTESSEVVINGHGKFLNRAVKGFDVELRPHTKLSGLLDLPRTLLILDETHKVKNSSTQASQAIHHMIDTVREKEGWVLHISATPFDQLFQLPQYLRFMGVDRDRAAELVGAAARLAGNGAACWDALRCLDQILSTAGLGFTPLAERLFTLSEVGGDTGPRWKAVREFLLRLTSFMPTHQTTSILISNGMQQPSTKDPVLSYSTADHITRYLRESRAVLSSRGILDAILWPLAAERMDFDIRLARDMVLTVLPRAMFRMVMPDLGFACHDIDLFLDDVDVAETVSEMTFLPDYKSMNVGPAFPAPLVSYDGAAHVPQARVEDWQSADWVLGKPLPVEVWRGVMDGCADSRTRSSAKVMYDMCKVALERSGEAEPDSIPNLRIRLEMLKVNSLFGVVRRTLGSDAGSKAVVMFNFLEPLKAFAEQCVGIPTISVTGAMPPSKRADAIESWNSDPSCRILLCTIQVMNEGIDLHDTRGGEHRYSFIMSCPSAIMVQQAKGRIFRAGVRSHAINCVVFGGYTLGGESEQNLVMRLVSKNATMHSARPTTTLTSREEFSGMCARIHSGAEATAKVSAQVGLTRARAGSGSQCEQQLGSFPETWHRREFALRSWPLLKSLRDTEPYTSEEWREMYVDRVLCGASNVEYLTEPLLAERQMRAMKLVPKPDSLPWMNCTTTLRLYHPLIEKGMTLFPSVPDPEKLRNVTFEHVVAKIKDN